MLFEQINKAVESSYLGGTVTPAPIPTGGTLIPAPIGPTSAPTGLAAAVADGQVSLSWNVVTGASSYNVYRGGQRVNVGPVTAFTYTDAAAIKGASYAYTITAVNGVGESVQSAPVSVVVLSPPNVPINLTATVGILRVTLDWDAPAASATASAPASYNVYRGGSLLVSGLANTAYTDLAVSTNVTYPYTVTCVSSVGESDHTTSISVVPAPPATPPGSPPGSPPPVAEVAAVQTTYTGANLTQVQEVDALGGAITRSVLTYNTDGTINTITETDAIGATSVTTIRYINGELDPANPLTRTVLP